MDPYDVIGIKRNASKAEIESAYRHKARELHPDKNGCASDFHTLQKAYEEIRDVEILEKFIDRDDPLLKRMAHSNFNGIIEINRKCMEKETIVEKWMFHTDNTVTVEIIDRIPNSI